MLKQFLLFPSSGYLRDKWWHRLTTVAFYAWLVVIVVWTAKALVFDPFIGCVKFAFLSQSDLDCGSNAFDYAFMNIVSEPITSIIFGTVFVVLALYVVAVMPSAVYRLVLYVVKGAKWRDSPDAD